MKRFFLIGLALLMAACVEDYERPWPENLQLLSVNAVYPAGYASAVHEGAVIRIEEVSTGAVYVSGSLAGYEKGIVGSNTDLAVHTEILDEPYCILTRA